MAAVIKRTWWSRGPTGRRVRRVAWGYTLQVNGQQERRYDAAWSRQDAEEALAKRMLAEATPPPPPSPKTLGEVVVEYLEYKRAKGKRSIRQDEQICSKLKRGFGAETPITEITSQRIAQYDRIRVTQTSKLGHLVTPSTVNRELAILRHMLRLAEEWGYITKVPKIRLAREPEGRLRFLTEEEVERLLAACREKRSKSPYLLPIVTIALNTGMRKGEILGLTWDCVDLSRGVLLLEHTKSGRRREVPMNRAVYDALQPLYAGVRASLPKAPTGEKSAEPTGLVFCKRYGVRAWGNIRTAFEAACREAKIHDFRFHDLRHTCASWLIMKGRSLKEVQELLGHREFSMTLRYAHLSPDRLREAVAVLEGFSTKSAQSAKIEQECLVSPRGPVAQVDRAAVS
jgi:integrase